MINQSYQFKPAVNNSSNRNNNCQPCRSNNTKSTQFNTLQNMFSQLLPLLQKLLSQIGNNNTSNPTPCPSKELNLSQEDLTRLGDIVYPPNAFYGLSGRPTLTGVVDTNNDQKLSAGDVGKIEFLVNPIPPDTSHVGKGEVILTQKQIDSFNGV
ncbi:hypothetical protein [Thiothrix winogradskyi]|uniref:Uncharacterized protein n=1 Tax=Thiothrix winogradskyi TaxID=96472 RepID=A0ABY3T269_9GAMM|nr:hypothetical protein [Thiothrix winogradskyi]UJS25450.1 hypothetical protein L2Y54_05260 [Thiothrix winogradskyi]